MFIRPIAQHDLSALEQMAAESGPGFTSLAADRGVLAARIERSIASFSQGVRQPGDESYLFVLEDEASGDILGISGIEAAVGQQRPLFHFHRQNALAGSRPARSGPQEVLVAGREYTGCAEICTLFLRPQFRRPQAGKLLSRVRFLFMAQHPERFGKRVIAEMRGVNQQGRSPFWDWLRPRFVDLDFTTVTRRVGAGDTDFIADHLPRQPLPLRQMPGQARAVIGQVHPLTAPALRLLEAEGFRHTGHVDLFDAGPTVETLLTDIRSVAQSRACRIQTVPTTLAGLNRGRQPQAGEFLAVCNTATEDFRALVTDRATYLPGANLLQLPQELADRLHLGNGGSARMVRLAAAGHGTGLGQPMHLNGQPEEVRHALR